MVLFQIIWGQFFGFVASAEYGANLNQKKDILELGGDELENVFIKHAKKILGLKII